MEPRKRTSRSDKARLKSTHAIKVPRREELMSDLMKKRLYDSYEVCELFGISLQSLRRAIAIKKIKAIHVGRALRIPAEEIEKMVQGEAALLNVQEAADLLNLSVYTIRNFIKREKLKAFRLTTKGPWKIAKSDVERIAQEGIAQ